MGFRFRKSINLGGGFRINLSKSGVGYSWGVKGYRITKTAKGTVRKTVSIPGTGISYVQETGKNSSKRGSVPANYEPVRYVDNNSNQRNTVQKTSNYEKNATNQTVRRGMKAWAIVCFVFAVIYALIALGVGAMLFGMTAFLAVLGIMLTVLSKSPKNNPYLLGKQSGMRKTTFVIICVAVAFCSFGLIAGAFGEIDVAPNSESTTTVVGEGSESKVTSIADFKTTEYDMLVGESLDFTVELRPRNLTSDIVGVEVSNANVLTISDVKFVTEGSKTILTFKCIALGEGKATFVVRSKTGDKTSNAVSFKVSTPPLVTAIGEFSPPYAIQEVGDKRTVTCYMKPLGLTQADFAIENSDDHIISVTNIALRSEDDKTVLTFDVTGVGVGKATIKIKGADGKTESNELQFTINEKDTSPTVYVTPYGEKYHFSAACAGSNATKTTQNRAISSGKGRCKKCG